VESYQHGRQPSYQAQSSMYDAYDEVEPRDICCACCCPCCIGDPTTPAWWKNAARSWFMSFTGLWTLTQFILYITMASLSQEHVPNDTLLDFGALDAPRVVHLWQVWRLLTAGLLHSRVFTMLMFAVIQMQFGWQQEVMLRWGAAATAASIISAVVASSLAVCLVNAHGEVSALGMSTLLAFLGSRLAWLYASWDVRGEELDGVASVTEVDMGSLSHMMPLSCPDTGARELNSMEKNCELFNYMFMTGIFLFIGLLTNWKMALAMSSAPISGFLVGGAIFMLRLRNKYPGAYTRWFTNRLNQAWPEVFIGIYIVMVVLLAGMLWGVRDIRDF